MYSDEPLTRHTARFYDWEIRGRGWLDHAHRVPLEPEFQPFAWRRHPSGIIDDARRQTAVSRMASILTNVSNGPVQEGQAVVSRYVNSSQYVPSATAPRFDELEILIPADTKIGQETVSWLRSTLSLDAPIAFELVGEGSSVRLQVAVPQDYADFVRSQLKALVPSASVRTPDARFRTAWAALESPNAFAVEFALAREFMLPLREVKADPDPLSVLVGAAAASRRGEILLLQILFEGAKHSWGEAATNATTSPDGDPFFIDAPEFASASAAKLREPLVAAAIRVLATAPTSDRVAELVRGMGIALGQYGDPQLNALTPLSGDHIALVDDILDRQTRRSGMILSLGELASIVRLPSEKLKHPCLLRQDEPLQRLPQEVLGEGVALGEAPHLKDSALVRIAEEARGQHTYVIGASGTGKSTLLVNLACQDVAAGRGVGVIDPHGDLVDEILARIPPERAGDLILFDPADPNWVVGWNILGAHSDLEKELLASDLAAAFRRLSTSWGDQMTTVLANAILAFLESPAGGTLTDLRRFLLDDDFRKSFVATIQDDHIRSFWSDEFPLLIGKKPQAPILTRLDTFLRSKLVRAVVTEREKPLNFRSIIDSQKIFLARLSQGAIGEENAALLGSLLVSKIHQVSLSRQDVAENERQPFFLYIDEFHHMATPSMAGLFSGVRKYKLGLTVAHQDLYQLHAVAPEVGRAALANAYTRIMFRVSDEDARKLEKGLDSFTADDFTGLGRGQAICRVGKREHAFRIKTLPLDPMKADAADSIRRTLRHQSCARYGRPRAEATSSRPQVNEAPPERVPPMPLPEAVKRPEPAPPRPVQPPAPGRGGPMHKYLQGQIRQAGQASGFKSEIERELPNGKRVDVCLTRGDLVIACEIAGNTTPERELANLEKCLEGGALIACSVSVDAPLLRKIQAALSSWPTERRAKVSVVSPEELLAFLAAQQDPAEAKVAGYTVRVRRSGTEANDSGRRQAVADVMLRSIRRIRGKT